MDLETKQLNKLIKDKTFVDVYTDIYDESFYGFIISFNDVFLVLDLYTEESKPDGISIFFRENISRIRWGGNDILSTYKLIENLKNSSNKIDISSIQSILKSVNSQYGYINISIQDLNAGVCFIGEITDMDEETIVINEFGTKTSLDRKNIMLSLCDITKIEAGGSYEEGLVKLLNISS